MEKSVTALTLWKSFVLAFTDRPTIVSEVFYSVPSYFMSVLKQSGWMFGMVDRAQRIFFWKGKSMFVEALRLINQKTFPKMIADGGREFQRSVSRMIVDGGVIDMQKAILKLILDGGLELQRTVATLVRDGKLDITELTFRNIALLFNWWQKFLQQHDAPWAKFLLGYLSKKESLPLAVTCTPLLLKASYAWKQLLKLKSFFNISTSICLGIGNKALLSIDPWLGNRAVRIQFPIFDHYVQNLYCNISNLWEEGKWSFHTNGDFARLAIESGQEHSDEKTWKCHSNSIFSFGLGYFLLTYSGDPMHYLSWFWKTYGPKLQSFLAIMLEKYIAKGGTLKRITLPSHNNSLLLQRYTPEPISRLLSQYSFIEFLLKSATATIGYGLSQHSLASSIVHSTEVFMTKAFKTGIDHLFVTLNWAFGQNLTAEFLLTNPDPKQSLWKKLSVSCVFGVSHLPHLLPGHLLPSRPSWLPSIYSDEDSDS